ncbi:MULTISPECIES: DUF1836 domain-containing protein [Lactobacillaceae]|uniref:DUF1836 domain-containing protein n=1 Tax=Lactobacillaceae TaxID=33958 RepID=UPI000C1B6870|nr:MULTISPECIES: DUF1836 domain-containing protein [Lactobacillaceae]
MDEKSQKTIADSIKNFTLPSYKEIPNVGLYLEQTVKYLNEYLEPLGDVTITNSMISNYVKKKLIDSPIKKQYSRDQIVILFFIAISKVVLSLEDINKLLSVQADTHNVQESYEYFCSELIDILNKVFSRQKLSEFDSSNEPEEKIMLQNVITAIANKIYLDKYFEML